MIILKIEPYQAMLDAIEGRLTEMGKENNMNNILRKSINEAASEGKEKLYVETKGYYTIKSRAFKKGDIVKRVASSRNPVATLTVRGEPLGVRKGYASRKNGRRKGASVQIIASSSMKELTLTSGGRAYKAFLATMKSGHTAIFQRVPGKYMKAHSSGKSKARESIKEILSLSKAKAAEMVYEKQGLYSELQEEISYRMLKQMNAVIGGAK